ncbi:MAG TPA: hypothetical protein VKN14_11355 [Flavobacteriaceae bacterium]|nr:hypothetical protein [Flavobacteriaceae bacterium]
MKKQVFIIAVLALFSFSCSTEDTTEIIDSKSTLEKQASLTSSMDKLLSSDEFRDYLNVKFPQTNAQYRTSGNGDNHGLMILNDGYNLAFTSFDSATSTLTFIGGSGSVVKMPNGKAKFSVHTNNPEAAVTDFTTFESISSDCIDGQRGVFNYNFISEYIVEVFEPIPGLVFTTYLATGENSSAQSGGGHCKISDAQPIYNDDFSEIIGCSDATLFKTVSLKANWNAKGEGGFSISVE